MSSPEQEARKRQTAVALAYGTGDPAPKVVAKGRGLVAEQIIGRAKEAGVFVHESKELVSLLMQVDLDKQIPPGLYRAIAELLAWLYYIESAQATGGAAPPPPETAHLLPPQEKPVGTDASNH
ncbi:EscU/YscU/HrcU family type III secretion system export apparatus switch protein [Massilia sp. YIM B02763]|uniref:EscU/YscU/HrcU family type III secretion system export apparatus switch protein n=1 Tax=Massilia sp. YIM B02763 TaxID=3050130 RepID=UPI0025B6904A|nr:EscU/YscU/HrcU family type III secretion system export apparatus switch protein [Massilia sp. YIM B02763]MDN4052657.1 EscU/YscU/HrcU family type III secretion system export apparatus switch protein [Massilia sp. YIM B02763]